MGTAALGQGTANGTEAGHEQGGLADGAHDNGGSGLGRCGSGRGRQCWWRTGPGLRHCSRLEVEAGDG